MKKQDFFVTSLSLVAIRLGGLGHLASPPGYAYDCNFNAIRDIKILCAFSLICICVMSKRHYRFYFEWSCLICNIIGKS